MDEPKKTDQGRRIKLWLNIITLVFLAILIYALRDSIAAVIEDLGRVNLVAILLIIPVQVINYHSYSRMYQSLLRILGHEVNYSSMFRVQLELNFVNHVFPSGGVTGISYFGVRMKKFGISPAKSTLVQTIKFILLFLSFEILVVMGLIMLALGNNASNFILLVGGAISTLLLVLSLGILFIIGSKQRINAFFTPATKIINKLIHIVRRSHPETINLETAKDTFTELNEQYILIKDNPRVLKQPIMWALLANITEVLTVYVVYLAFGQLVNPGAVILAYAVANFAGLISVLPGGIGIYETLMTLVLASSGVPASVSIPVTLMYRVVSTVVQLVPGYFFYHQALREQPNAN